MGLSFSLQYAPPEAVRAYVDGHKTIDSSPAADIWAFGVVAFELLTARRTFPPRTPAAEVWIQLTLQQHATESILTMRLILVRCSTALNIT